MSSPVKPAMPLLDGRFQLESLLGRGGMAEVFRAVDLRHGRTVAVKVLRDDVLDAFGAERFRREIAVTAAFTHPHILGLLEAGEAVMDDGRTVLYYVMPLVEGETLGTRLAREDHLPLSDALRLTRGVLEALRYAHDHGVIHRDIKPSNILLSGGHAVVADFGIARPVVAPFSDDSGGLPSLTISGVAVGTPAYMSPEQAFGGASVDARCDLYAAGCVLYEMLTGRAPFDANTGQAVMARKMSGVFVPAGTMRPGLPPVVDDILASALEPDPADRFPSAAAFLSALDQLGETGSSRRISHRTQRRARQSVWKRTGIIAAVTVLSVGAIGAWRWTHAPFARSKGPDAAGGTSDPSRIAVLPFENLSADSSLAYVANGITTDLIDQLAQVRALTVVSKNGVLPFLKSAVGLDSMARALRVGSIITGDVRRSGDRVSVSVRLVDGRTGRQLASHDTSASISDVLAVGSSVAEDAAFFLRTRVGEQVRMSAGRRRASNAEAWELVERVRVLRAGELKQVMELTTAERARRFQHADSFAIVASRLDTRWPDPLVERALLALQHANAEETAARTSTLGAEQLHEKAQHLWRDAVQLSREALIRDPDDASALRARGAALMEIWLSSRDDASDSLRAHAESDLRRAVDLRPDLASAWTDLSSLLWIGGDFSAAEQAAAEALRADEYLANAPDVLARLQFAALGADHAENAARWCAEGRRRYPGNLRFTACELTTLGWTANKPADVTRAWQVLDSAERQYTPDVLRSGWVTRRFFVADIAARAGLRDSALAIVARARTGAPAGTSSVIADYGEAYVRTLLGQRDEALHLLDGYLTKFPIQRRTVARIPWFRSLRADERFVRMTATR